MARTTKPPKPVEIVTDSTQFAAKCPKCGMPISLQATVTAFMEPYKWDFWGRPSQRWQRCKGESGGYQYVHFRVLLNGRFNERIAWLKPAPAAPAAVQEQLL